MGRKGRHSVVLRPGAARTILPCPCSVPGSVRRDPGERHGVQTFPVPERNVSALSCWLCHLLPWKSGFCPLLGPFCFFHQPGDRSSGSPSLSESSHRSAASSAPSTVPWCPSSVPGVTVIPFHSLSPVPFGTAGAMPALSSPAFGTQRSLLQHRPAVNFSPCSVSPACPLSARHSSWVPAMLPALPEPVVLGGRAGFGVGEGGAGRILAPSWIPQERDAPQESPWRWPAPLLSRSGEALLWVWMSGVQWGQVGAEPQEGSHPGPAAPTGWWPEAPWGRKGWTPWAGKGPFACCLGPCCPPVFGDVWGSTRVTWHPQSPSVQVV